MSGVEIVLALLGIVGVGGIVTAVMTKRKELAFKVLETKERRYKSWLKKADFEVSELDFTNKSVDNSSS
ncbi:MAG TPA: hypothetical protein VGQ55_03240 [Pyrinomonadaceae bacterium]|jgi:phosphoglycerate dehydrogenase-like enzyme|nr:hypothetical protein [Pyrinomonadaceae bacterium]